MSLRRWWMIVALGCTVAACGTATDDSRFTLRTPGAEPGAPVKAPAAVPDVTPAATPGVIHKPVTAGERRVIRGWADELRHGRVDAAARYFAVPSVVVTAATPTAILRSRGAVV